MSYYEYTIRDKYIDEIISGTKKVDFRLNDPAKGAKVKIGDILVLVSKDFPERYVRVEVQQRDLFYSWKMVIDQFWDSNLKKFFPSKEKALEECAKSYSEEKIKEVGIVAFRVEKEIRPLKKSSILLDQDIIVQREGKSKVSKTIKHLFDILENNLQATKYIFKDVLTCIEKKSRDERLISQIRQNYQVIKNEKNESSILANTSSAIIDKNNIVSFYEDVLELVENNQVNYFITEDRELIRKAREKHLDCFVLTVDEFQNYFFDECSYFTDYKILSLKRKPFKEEYLQEKFFTSLKEDYGEGFIKWFIKKSNSEEKAYIYENESHEIKGFLYLKIENEDEDYSDFVKPFSPKKRLKIGTFKVESTGLRVGERFIKIIIDQALNNHVKEIYVTLFENKREEVRILEKLLKDWGFCFYTTKKSNGETVLLKSLEEYDKSKGLEENYPLIPLNPKYFFLPILADYHLDLFPDMYTSRDKINFDEEMACRYSLKKIYITKRSKLDDISKGDVLIIYRMGKSYPKKYSSVVTGRAIFIQKHEVKTFDEIKKKCKNRTVFSDEELEDYFNEGYRYIIELLYLDAFEKFVTLNDLQLKGIVEENSGPRIGEAITKEQYQAICEMGGVKP